MSTTRLVKGIRLVGDPILSTPSERVNPKDAHIVEARIKLHDFLDSFRKQNGFGRGIAAPQIGFPYRMIALNLGGGFGFTMHNPELFDHSEETFTMYDDCFSFPDMLVKVRRHITLSVRYFDDNNNEIILRRVDQPLAELLQHEVDHLDGISSFDRAEGKHAVVHRNVYESNKQEFDKGVDFAIY
jgi:peptide deformylase